MEILIHDDASTDDTADIVREYARLYPDLIKPLYATENQYSQGKSPGSINSCRATGRYIAWCEGDDYWTDPQKLQCQAEFLETDPELALCHHEVNYVSYVDGKEEILRVFPDKEHRRRKRSTDLIGVNFIQTCSMMIRRCYVFPRTGESGKIKLGDWLLCYLAAENGDIGYIDRNMAAYRIHENNTWCHVDHAPRMAETSRLCFYLAKHAMEETSRDAWRETGFRVLKSLFGDNPAFGTACRRLVEVLRAGGVPAPTVIRCFLGCILRNVLRRVKS